MLTMAFCGSGWFRGAVEEEAPWTSSCAPALAKLPPCELVAAYKECTEHGPQHQDAETGLGASAYWFGERVLIVYEESETGVVVLIDPTS